MAGLSSRLQSLVDEWLKYDQVSNTQPDYRSVNFVHYYQNPTTRNEIEALAKAKDEGKLNVLLGSRMTFGTAGVLHASSIGRNYYFHFSLQD